MSTLKINRTQLGQSNTATNNFTLTAEAADGTMKLARGNAGATTQDIITVASNGVVDFPQLARTLGTSGSFTLPGGLIVKWGAVPSLVASGTSVVTFPGGSFPTAVVSVMVTPASSTISSGSATSATSSGFTLLNNNSGSTVSFYWLAIGY